MNISKCILQNREVISLGEFLVLMAIFVVSNSGPKEYCKKTLNMISLFHQSNVTKTFPEGRREGT